MEIRWETVGPNVVRAEQPFQAIAFCPSGALIAAHRQDRATGEAVHVMDACEAREVVALEGALRGFGWVDARRLLVVRDHARSVRVTLHEMPDGGEVASLVLHSTPQRPMSVEVSADRRRALLRGKTQGEVTYICAIDLGEMRLLRELETVRTGGVLNGDGTCLAEASRELRLYALDPGGRDEVLPITGASWWGRVSLRSWPSPDVLRGVAVGYQVRLERGPEGVSQHSEPPEILAALPDFNPAMLLGRAVLPTHAATGIVVREVGKSAKFSLVSNAAALGWSALPYEHPPSRAALHEHPSGVSMGLVSGYGTRLFVLKL